MEGTKASSNAIRTRQRVTGGELDPEFRAAFIAIPAACIAMMSMREGSHEREAESHAWRVRSGGAAAGVALPDLGEIGGGKTRAAVMHDDAHFVIVHSQGERDAAAARCVGEGVVEQVGDGLIRALAVEQHPALLWHVEIEAQAAFLGGGLVELVQIAEQGMQLDDFEVQL